MTSAALTELIKKLEAAGEGSRDLDAEICLLVVQPTYHGTTDPVTMTDICVAGLARQYTTSLDAALSLIGERWTDFSLEICRAKFATPDPAPCCAWIADGDLNNPRVTQLASNAATGPLAIAAVALKALALSPDNNS